MKQNITLRIEKDLLKKGKLLAAQRGTSISKLLSDLLKRIVNQEDRYEAAKRNALHTLDQGFHLGGEISWKPEDLYYR